LKNACPTAKSYAVVDAASASTSFSCAVVNNTYTVTFCPDNSEFDPKY
jgi:nitrogen fixation protein FixH